MKSLTSFVFAMVALALAAPLVGGCGDSQPAEQPDAGTDDANYDEHIIEGGGTTGGPIDGLLVLWFFDDPSDDPIEGVQVMIGSDPDSALIGTTDGSGQVVFEDPSLSGPTDVHYLHDDYPAGSLYGLDATFVTLGPSVIGYDADPPTVTISGSASGFDAVPEPDNPTTQHRIALVNFGLTLEDLLTGDYEEIEQADDPEFGMVVNMLAPDLPGGGKNEFSLEVYERVGTLFAAAGIFDTVAETFTTYAVAIDPGFDPNQDSIDDVELALSHEIVEENTLAITVDPVPAEYEQIGGHVWVDLGADGTFSLGVPPVTPGETIEIRLPDVTAAPFDEAGILFAANGGQDVEDADDNYPSGQRWVRDVTLEAAIGSGVEIDDLLAPSTDLSWDGSELSLSMPSGISYGGARAENEDEDVLWGATVYDPPTDAIAVPDFPDDWGWNGLPESGLRIYSGAGVIEGDINEAVFDDLWYQNLGSSENMIESN